MINQFPPLDDWDVGHNEYEGKKWPYYNLESDDDYIRLSIFKTPEYGWVLDVSFMIKHFKSASAAQATMEKLLEEYPILR